MPKREKIAVCVDSSIFLAEVFGNETQSTRVGAIDKSQKIFQFKKYMSVTVKNEISRRLSKITTLIGQVSQNFIDKFRLFKGIKSTTNLSDLSFIQSFFSDLKKSYSVRSSELEIINNIESVLVQYLTENYSKKQGLRTEDFVLNSMVEFNKILSRINFDYYSKLGGYELFSVNVNPEICKKLQNAEALVKTVKNKPQDIKILCEVESHKQNLKQTCLLVTVDRRDFLNNSKTIESLVGIKCVDPIYIPNEFRSNPTKRYGRLSDH